MNALRTAILEHTTATGVHHDWLIEDPSLPDPKAPDARLWTARVTPPPQDWPQLKRFELTVIPPHRRVYLDYEGPVSGNRGAVRRLMSGVCIAAMWSDQRIVVKLINDSAKLEIELFRQSVHHWVALLA